MRAQVACGVYAGRQSPNGVAIRFAVQLLLSSLHEWQLERLAGCLAHLLILIFVVG
jgi:hypothetical protein